MNFTCLSKTMIPESSDVRFLIIVDDTTHTRDILMSTYKTDDQFKILGMPLKAKLESHGYCKIIKSPEADLTLELLKANQREDFKELEDKLLKSPEDDIWTIIQSQIFDKKLISKTFKRGGIFQIALIDEDVYQMCLKQGILSHFGRNFKDAEQTFLSSLKEAIKDVDASVEERMLTISTEGKPPEYKDSLKNMFIESMISAKIENLGHVFNDYFKSRTLEKAIKNDLSKQIFSDFYVLSVLNENGYYIYPTNTLHDMMEQTNFTKLLLKEQIVDSLKDDVSDVISFPIYEYTTSLKTLKEQIIEWYGLERMEELMEGITEGSIIDVESGGDLEDVLDDSLPSYIKYLKIVGEE